MSSDRDPNAPASGQTMSPKRYVGRVCKHHPEGGGVRYKSTGTCVHCVAISLHRYQAAHPDRVRKNSERWRQKNRDKVNAAARARRAARKTSTSPPASGGV